MYIFTPVIAKLSIYGTYLDHSKNVDLKPIEGLYCATIQMCVILKFQPSCPYLTHLCLKNTLVLMQNGIVNMYQLLCDAYIVPEQHSGTADLFLFYLPSCFSPFSFCVVATLSFLFLFFGASIVCVNKLKRAADLVLLFPDTDKTSVCTHPWHKNDLSR